MTICDNGVGIKSSDTFKVNSFGLRGMQERVAALSGTLDIDPFSKQGTVITVKLPIE
jgi:signal transduction histidine kinase